MIELFPSQTKRAVLLVALAAAGTGVARADGSSMDPFIGDSYATFNGANRPAIANPRFDGAASAWRQAHPDGLSEQKLQQYASAGLAWTPSPPTYGRDTAVASFRQSHPNGLTQSELQALSTGSSPWQLRAASPTAAMASEPSTTLAQGSPSR